MLARRILGVAMLSSRWMVRQPLWFVQSFVAAIGICAILFAWGGVQALKSVVVAYFVISFWNLGLNLVAQEYGWSRIMKLSEMYATSGISPATYLAGSVLGTVPMTLSMVVPAVVLAHFLGFLHTVPALLLISAASLALGASLGLAIIIRLKEPRNISAITNPLVTATTILPPVYYPAAVLPPPLKQISLAVPTVSLAEIARWIVGIGEVVNSASSLAIVLAWTLALFSIVGRKLKWSLE